MSNIIDRRLNPRDKTIRNRQKFIQRSKEAIRKQVREVINKGSIKDVDTTKSKIRVKGVSEPSFSMDRSTGNKKYVLPGNKTFSPGDNIPKPPGGSGGRGNKAGEGVGEDDFEFLLTQDEFVDFLMEELELPNLVKKQFRDLKQVEFNRAGFKSHGTPNQLDIVRSLKGAIGRRIGMKRPKDEDIEELERLIQEEEDKNKILDLQEQLESLRKKMIGVPWLDPFDMKYRNFTPTPKPITKAVMFCVMDVSASMGEKEKDIAKRFFMLLHVFLKRKYEKLDVVFIAHHNTAKEVDEHAFFYDTETGGTLVSSAIELTNKIIKERYSPQDYNIYVAQCSDGDNAPYDAQLVIDEMEQLIPLTQYMAYLEVRNEYYMGTDSTTSLWDMYENLATKYEHMNMRTVFNASQVWEVFSQLFAKENTL